jgi:hypothetical protein
VNLPDYNAAFQQKHPEAGDISTGVHISAEQLQQFGDIIGGKVDELGQKAELTSTEMTFIDRTMDLGTRSVIYAHERFGIPIPESENTVDVALGIGELQGNPPAPQDVVYGLHSITGSRYTARTNPEYRSAIEKIGGGSIRMLGEMASITDGMTVDDYLAGNLQNIIGHFEQIEQQ